MPYILEDMTYLLAISGGVDSVVLLDMMARLPHDIVVAHVDHGIREDSAADARFVEQLARRYAVPFVSIRYELGPYASEEQARKARYDFLLKEAKQRHEVVVTAHHQDDLVETIALNISRGWRGLAVFDRDDVRRPLLQFTKRQLIDYALRHRLEWVEDSTNQSDRYLRNRLRRRIGEALTQDWRDGLVALRRQQIQLKQDILEEESLIVPLFEGMRYGLIQIDTQVACEILGVVISQAGGVRPTRPQLERAVLAIKTAKPSTIYDVGSGVRLLFTTRKFSIEVLQ